MKLVLLTVLILLGAWMVGQLILAGLLYWLLAAIVSMTGWTIVLNYWLCLIIVSLTTVIVGVIKS